MGLLEKIQKRGPCLLYTTAIKMRKKAAAGKKYISNISGLFTVCNGGKFRKCRSTSNDIPEISATPVFIFLIQGSKIPRPSTIPARKESQENGRT